MTKGNFVAMAIVMKMWFTVREKANTQTDTHK